MFATQRKNRPHTYIHTTKPCQKRILQYINKNMASQAEYFLTEETERTDIFKTVENLFSSYPATETLI